MNSDNFKIIGVSRDIVTIEVIDPTEFKDQFNIGSYIQIPYKHESNNFIIGIIKNYKIKNLDSSDPQTNSGGNSFIIEVELIGSYTKNSGDKPRFERGAHGIPLPPNNGIELLSSNDLSNILSSKFDEKEKFTFSSLSQNDEVKVPVNGNKFFNKHFAIVGSTGSGKSHAVAAVLQQAIKEKESGGFDGLNNSHIVIFDIHGEYKKAFPTGNHIDSSNIKIPYWLLNSEELEELFLESGDFNNYNQVSLLRLIITINKEKHNPDEKIFFDSPVKFNLDEILNCLKNLAIETKNYKNTVEVTIKSGYKTFDSESEKIMHFFDKIYEFEEPKNSNFSKGTYADGTIDKFISRLQTKINDKRLGFLLDKNNKDLSFESILKKFIGYEIASKSNITVIDLSGIPFEVLSITVSLISRLLFEYGYYYKRLLGDADITCETPLLLVYEEAHKYVPKSDLAKYKASRNAIERIAKEGRKYGVTLGIVSQRPSEISETIFSQCNNFIAMRLTNPDDQAYVKKLLPDTLGDITNYLSSLQSGEALLIGESIVLPSLVKIDSPELKPSSTDISYLDLWKEEWKKVDFEKIKAEWNKV